MQKKKVENNQKMRYVSKLNTEQIHRVLESIQVRRVLCG